MSPAVKSAIKEALAGSGIGLLVGLLAGLSVTAVAGSVVTGLMALLAAFLGLRGGNAQRQSTHTADSTNAWRLAAFGFVCAGALLVGLAVRSNNLLSKTPQQRVEEWVAAGFPQDVAREYAAYEDLGVAQADWNTVNEGRIGGSGRSALFTQKAADRCGELNSNMFETVEHLSEAYHNAGGMWELSARLASEVRSENRLQLLQAAWSWMCDGPARVKQ